MHLKSVTIHPDRFPDRESYPFNLPVFQRRQTLAFTTPVTLFAGENGSGKSTLLAGMAVACGIHIWREAERSRCTRNPYEGDFHRYLDLGWTDGRVPGSFFGSAIFTQFARLLDEWAADDPGQLAYFGGKSLLTQSHGQSLMSYFRSRYRIRGLYFLDEPETALSPKSQLELLDILPRAAAKHDAQFIIATHSPLLLACPGAVIQSFDADHIEPVAYEDTAHFRIYKGFLDERG